MSMLPTVDFCGLRLTRLLIGANPFGGYSHQNPQRDEAMRNFHSVPKILETWERAKAAGINTFVTNNETPHVLEAVKAYFSGGGTMQWISQINGRNFPNMPAAIDDAVKIGCKGIYFHGLRVENLYAENDAATLKSWCDHARSLGIPIGVAAHDPKVHLWVNELDIVDFHAVCFFNCGSLHSAKGGGGSRFQLCDVPAAIEAVRAIKKPCIAYKIMGAGRIDAQMAFEHAFANIKPNDVVNVGMHRGDNDSMVEDNAAIVRKILVG
ncbi:MAG: hypothetical protein FWD53_02485 [Phycisphaerales bacterium]|nr:hypothetical protein [Phycisphaerales bacterium]